MPQVNAEKCYQLPTQKTLPSAEHLDLDFFKKELGKRIDGHIADTYELAEELASGLRVIQYALSNLQVQEDTKRMIVLKLQEGAEECTPGFHNRVNSILLGLKRPQTIDEFLAQIRIGIVDTVAHQQINEVHNHNKFYIEANARGFGVPPLNKNDSYIRRDRPLLTDDQSHALEKALAAHYSGLAILSALQLDIEAELRLYYGYKGLNSEGYIYYDYEKIADYLKDLFNETNGLTYEDIFVITEEEKITNINWPSIQNILWEKLASEEYLVFTAEERDFFSAIYTDSLTIHNLNQVMILSESYPAIVKYLSLEKKVELISQYFKSTPKEISHYLSGFLFFFVSDVVELQELFKGHLSEWLREASNKKILLDFFDFTVRWQGIRFPLESIPLSFIREELIMLPDLFFQVIARLKPEAQATILMSKDENGRNSLMHAIRKAPVKMPDFLRAIARLKQEAQVTIFTTTNKKDNSALISAVTYQPQVVPALLQTIAALGLEERARILTATDNNGRSALMLAVMHQPTVVPYLLKAIATLMPHEQATLLMTINNGGWNVLTQAVWKQPIAVPPLLQLIANIAPAARVNILVAINEDGCNALMLAARHQPTLVPNLLQAIASLNPEAEAAILMATNNDGKSALMLAAKYQSSVVPALLERIATLAVEDQIDLLTKRNKFGMNVLSYSPQKFAPLFTNERVCFEVFSEAHRYLLNGLFVFHKKLPRVCSNKLEDILKDAKENNNTNRMTLVKLGWMTEMGHLTWQTPKVIRDLAQARNGSVASLTHFR